MNWLLMVNAVLFAFLCVIWSKSDMLNVVIKTVFLILCLSNGFQSYQLFEQARIEAAHRHAGEAK